MRGPCLSHRHSGSNLMKQWIAVLVAATFSLAPLAQTAAPGAASTASPAAAASAAAPAKAEAKKTKKKKAKKHTDTKTAPVAAPAK